MLAASSLAFVPCGVFGAKTNEFWNDEDPDKWSSEEIQQLTTDSPWAKPGDSGGEGLFAWIFK